MQLSSSAVESGALTTCMKAIVTEWSTLSDDARDLVNAAQVLLKGNQDKPWGV